MNHYFNTLAEFFKGKIYYDEPLEEGDPDPSLYYPKDRYPSGYARRLAFGRSATIIVCLATPIASNMIADAVKPRPDIQVARMSVVP